MSRKKSFNLANPERLVSNADSVWVKTGFGILKKSRPPKPCTDDRVALSSLQEHHSVF